jgi:hypothetical protein
MFLQFWKKSAIIEGKKKEERKYLLDWERLMLSDDASGFCSFNLFAERSGYLWSVGFAEAEFPIKKQQQKTVKLFVIDTAKIIIEWIDW